jgi:hypothetical protein
MPLPANTETKTPERKDWPLIPEDIYQVEITDLTAEESEWKGEKRDVFKFEFTIIEPGEYYRRKLWKKGSPVSPCPSTNNKAPLTWKVVSAVLKRPLKMDEGKSFSVQGYEQPHRPAAPHRRRRHCAEGRRQAIQQR